MNIKIRDNIYITLKYIAILLLAILAGSLFRIFAAYLPDTIIRSNIRESMGLILSGGVYPQNMGVTDVTCADAYTECLILNDTYLSANEDPVASAFSQNVYSNGMNRTKALNELVNMPENMLPQIRDNPELVNGERSSYWMGIVPLLRVLLMVLNYEQCRVLLQFVFFATAMFVVVLTYKKCGVSAALSFGVALISINMFVAASLFHTAVVFIIAFALCIYLLIFKEKEVNSGQLFFLAGILTAYFDWMSTPMVVYGLPMFMVLVIAYKNDKVHSFLDGVMALLKTALAWSLGYVAMLLSRGILCRMILGNTNATSFVFSRVRFLSSNLDFGNSIIEQICFAIVKNTQGLFPFYAIRSQRSFLIILILIISVLAIILLIFKNKKKQCLTYTPMLILGLAPYAWYIVFNRHCAGHAFFTYRSLIITVASLCFFVLSLLDYEKITNYFTFFINLIKKYSTAVKFVLVGALCTGVDLFLYLIFIRSFNVVLAKGISMVIAVLLSFILNKKWSFNYSGKATFKLLARFCVSQLGNIGTNVMVNALVVWFTKSVIIAFACATLVAMIVNYLLQKNIVFKYDKLIPNE